MYDYITGKISKISKDSVTIEANGVGYRLFVTTNLVAQAVEIKTVTTLYVSFVVREFAHTFFGFLQEQERDLFEALLGISGVGPRTSLAIIGTLSLDELFDALTRKDAAMLCRVPGIGKKTAERLLVELKDTLSSINMQTVRPVSPRQSLSYDAVSALTNLGLSPLAAKKAVTKVLEETEEPQDLSSLIALSLKNVTN